jgi:hypothetical protein
MPIEEKIPLIQEITPLQRLLKVLGHYKELITIIVFFAGGVSWIFGFFATKQQTNEMRCVMEKNMDQIENQMQSKFLQDELMDIGRQLEELTESEKMHLLSERDKQKKLYLNSTSRDLTLQRDEAMKKLAKAKEALNKNICRSS